MRIIKRNKHYTSIGSSLLEKNKNKKNINQQKNDWALISLISVPIFIFIGFIYLTSFLGEFGISYEMYFKISDCINFFYIKSLLYYFLISFVILFCTPFLAFLIQMGKNNVRNKINIIRAVLLILILLFSLFILYKSNFLSLQSTGIIALVIVFIVIIWFFLDSTFAIIIGIAIFSVSSYMIGIEEAKEVKKRRKTFNIVLKNNDTILRDNDPNRYFIYKTTDFIFLIQEDTIKQEKNGVEKYYFRRKYITKPVSEIQEISSVTDTTLLL
ncbi:hypothetical protein [Capnocytophaga sp. oral taxon 903]|jgi:membrane protein|uniref:hypothetical protein n=1 Tax=Capnocytophaga sp. oral taxon 903 TaxID=2748317 RepID=UPI0015BFD861|nr:hypothetical protein [Capnocytophaga sp. oral taxon 903]NWO30212.1 hypothetical protein [Capnocytophaga sp. oral taxon 903]